MLRAITDRDDVRAVGLRRRRPPCSACSRRRFGRRWPRCAIAGRRGGRDRCLLKAFDAKFWGVVVMGGAVVILFFLPWLDHSPVQVDPLPSGLAQVRVRRVRARSSWCSATWACSRRRTIGERVSQIGTLFYFGFFLLMPWWSRLGEFKPVPDARTLRRALSSGVLGRAKRPMKKLILILIAGLRLSRRPRGQRRRRPGTRRPNKLNDLASLQNGAKLFVNYCLNCHSAAYMRYNRLRDIGLTEAADQGQPAVRRPTRSATR